MLKQLKAFQQLLFFAVLYSCSALYAGSELIDSKEAISTLATSTDSKKCTKAVTKLKLNGKDVKKSDYPDLESCLTELLSSGNLPKVLTHFSSDINTFFDAFGTTLNNSTFDSIKSDLIAASFGSAPAGGSSSSTPVIPAPTPIAAAVAAPAPNRPSPTPFSGSSSSVGSRSTPTPPSGNVTATGSGSPTPSDRSDNDGDDDTNTAAASTASSATRPPLPPRPSLPPQPVRALSNSAAAAPAPKIDPSDNNDDDDVPPPPPPLPAQTAPATNPNQAPETTPSNSAFQPVATPVATASSTGTTAPQPPAATEPKPGSFAAKLAMFKNMAQTVTAPLARAFNLTGTTSNLPGPQANQPAMPPAAPAATPPSSMDQVPPYMTAGTKTLGLNNANGDDCFFSAAMQCLARITPLMAFLENNDTYRNGAFQGEFYQFMRALWQQPSTKYDPLATATKVFRNISFPDRPGQQDADDFLSNLLCRLLDDTPYHAAINLEIKTVLDGYGVTELVQNLFIKRFKAVLDNNGSAALQTTFADQFRNNLSPERVERDEDFAKAGITSPQQLPAIDAFNTDAPFWNTIADSLTKVTELKSIFDLSVTDIVTCNICKATTSTRTLSCKRLPLFINGSSLQELLSGHFASTNLAKRCTNCFKRDNPEKTLSEVLYLALPKDTPATKTVTIRGNLPRFLVFSFSRFQGPDAPKIATPISFPQTLETKDFYQGSPDTTYQLQSFVVHTGATGGGHYRAFVKNPDGTWFQYDDATVTPVDQGTIDTITEQNGGIEEGSPYVLFYKRVC